MDMIQLKQDLFNILTDQGAKLIGVANLKDFVDDDMTIGVAVGIPIPAHIVKAIEEAPTLDYYKMYHTLNKQLDHIVEAGADFLTEKGYKARGNTRASIDMNENFATPLPYKTVATRAGLGWIGKSCLLVTEQYGSAVRISSLVTNAPLPFGQPINESRCGKCHICVDKCPANALKGTLWKAGIPREKLFNAHQCNSTMISRMRTILGFYEEGEGVCGRCFAVCPFTKRYLKRADDK